MSEFQTSIQDLTAILRGSGKLEISAFRNTPSWIDAGTLSGLEFDEGLETASEENDNADSDDFPYNQAPVVKATLHEALRAPIWDLLRTGLDTKTTTAASSQTTNQDFEASETSAGVLYPITSKNSDGSEPTFVVKEDTAGDGTYSETYVAGTDYRITKDQNDQYYIEFISGGSYTATKAIRVAVTHTPAASVKYVSGGASELPWFMVRITVKNGDYPFYLIGYKCKIKTGKKFSFPKDNDKDRRVKVAIEINLKADTTYHGGSIYETVQTGGLS